MWYGLAGTRKRRSYGVAGSWGDWGEYKKADFKRGKYRKAVSDRIVEPSSWLRENIDLLPRGRALDVAMGRGADAVYLGLQGFQVEGVDISAGAVEAALEAAREAGVPLETRVADLEGGYEIQKGVYDVIVCFNYLQRSLFQGIKDGLKRGGVVVYETFTLAQRQFGRPRNPDYLLEPGELRRLVEEYECLRYREGIVDGPKAVSGIVARKPGGSGGVQNQKEGDKYG